MRTEVYITAGFPMTLYVIILKMATQRPAGSISMVTSSTLTSCGRLVQDVDSLIGKQSDYLLKVNKTLNCLTVYAKDGNNGYIIPVKAMLTSRSVMIRRLELSRHRRNIAGD